MSGLSYFLRVILIQPANSIFLIIQYHNHANRRIFDVFVEGVLVADNLDIYARAPGTNVPYIITVSTFITDGAVTIDLERNKDNPQINGIEVFDDGEPIPAPTVAPQALPPFEDIVINCGGTSYNPTQRLCISSQSTHAVHQYLGPLYLEKSGRREWIADSYFVDGSTYSITNVPVLDTVDDPIYQSERVGLFSYSIPVPVGTYEINIHLAELYVLAKTFVNPVQIHNYR